MQPDISSCKASSQATTTIKSLLEAALQALENHNTEALKSYLRLGCNDEYVFLSLSNDHVPLSHRDLFLKVKAAVAEHFPHPDGWRLNYNVALGNILLHLATRISDYELATFLLGKGANVESVDKEGRTALHIACKKNCFEIIKLLTKDSPAHILDLCDNIGDTPLDTACESSSPEVVQYLLSKGSSVLRKASRAHGPLFRATRNTAEYATAIASLVLDAGADVNYACRVWATPLIAAVDRLLSENATTSQGYSYLDLCMLLIERGCDVNAVNKVGETALHIAVRTKKEILVQKLLISGSDIDGRDADGFTPLHYACEYANRKLVDLLLDSGANLLAQDLETTLEKWKSFEVSNEESIQLLKYANYKSNRCRTLRNMCNITIRENVRNVEKNAHQLGLPLSLVKGLQLKD